MIVASQRLRDGFVQYLTRTFRNPSAQFSCSRNVVDFPSCRIRRLVVDARFLKRQRVAVGCVPAAVFDLYRMIRNRCIQMLDLQWASIGSFRVVVFKSQNPLACWSLRRALPQRLRFPAAGSSSGNNETAAIEARNSRRPGLMAMFSFVKTQRNPADATPPDILASIQPASATCARDSCAAFRRNNTE